MEPEYNHVITLLSSASYTTDDYGNQIRGDNAVTCLCAVSSVSGAEFYRAGQSGIKPSAVARLNKLEYSGQQRCELDGDPYTVIRMYEVGYDEIELTLEPKAGV